MIRASIPGSRRHFRKVFKGAAVNFPRRALLFEPLESRRMLADFGDAPASFATTLAANGPRHQNTATLFFGTTAATDVDSEADGQPSTFADADETTGQFDETGVSGQSGAFAALAISPGTTATVFVTASTVGLLDAFIDFNDDGDFADAGEKIFSSQALVAGQNTLTFAVPAAATGGANNLTFGRWRISTAGALSFTGDAADGEVEDHSIDVVAAQACSLVVTTTGDAVNAGDGVNSLREAIICANSDPDLDTISFNIPGAGPHTISPGTELPTLTAPVIIDGYTQGSATADAADDAQPNTNPAGQGLNTVLKIELSGASLSAAGGPGLRINAGGSTVRGLAINRFKLPVFPTPGPADAGFGIALAVSGGNTIEGNFIGTDVTGALARENQVFGVFASSANNTIGGTTVGARNLISGNRSDGIHLEGAGATGNRILGNLIGTDRTGALALGNRGSGVLVNAPGNTIGGIASGSRNVMSANELDGLTVGDTLLAAVTGNIVQGNLIGTDVTGNLALGNQINGLGIFRAPNNTIGGTTPEARNVISANVVNGLNIFGSQAEGNVVQGNFIGTNAAGTQALGNQDLGIHVIDAPRNTFGGTAAGARNVISANVNAGIAFQRDGSTGNVVQGNLIGTDLTGTQDLGNGLSGIAIASPANTIGGTAAGAGNVISGNDSDGIFFSVSNFNPNANGNVVQGNLIGTQIDGTSALGNSGPGVIITTASVGTNIGGNTIGGAVAGAGNVIAFNTGDGIVAEGAGATGGTANAFRGNSIFSNGALGIDLLDNGVTENDSGDGDTGPNNLFNFPVLVSATIVGSNLTLTGFARPGSIIEFFIADGDASGFGEGRTFLVSRTEGTSADEDTTTGTYGPGSVNGLNQGTDTTNAYRFTFPVPAGVAAATVLTATATDSAGNTSEFSGNVTVTAAVLLDFGDAPDSYGTTLSANGARHTIANPFLGAARDGEVDGQPTTGATGDDTAGVPDDEDGVTIGDLTQGTTASVAVVSSANFAELDAFVDFNIDGDFADAGEKIFASVQLNAGLNNLTFNVPANATLGNAFARFRISFAGGLSFNGQATGGEVEDYAIRIVTATPPACSLIVTSTSDAVDANDAGNSLREAILCSNSTAGTDTITFTIPGAGPHSITPATPLPTIDDSVVIDGLSQPGSDCNTTVSTLRIELNGSGAGAGSHGLTITAGNSTIRGLVVNRFTGNGILLQTNGDNIVECNFVGLNVAGSAALANGGHGVFVDNTPNNRIGGDTRISRNVISGNTDAGVSIVGLRATGNRVLGNFIGTDAGGTLAIGNTEGVEIYNASDNAVGAITQTPGQAPGNIISGNNGVGVEIASGVRASAFDNRILGNIIGLNAAGNAALPNQEHGVAILDAFDNQVGIAGTTGTRNIISANLGAGVFVKEDVDPTAAVDNEIGNNFIGTDIGGTLDFKNGGAGVHLEAARTRVDQNVIAFNDISNAETGVVIIGDAATLNRLTANSMFSNGGLGINLSGGSQNASNVTLNDSGDADTGPNDLLNFPVLTSTTISGANLILEGFARPGSIIELFIAAPDPSGFGEGRTLAATLTEGAAADTDTGTGTYGPGAVNGLVQGTDTTNRFRFTIPTPAGIAIGTVLTSTATDANGNTSEFSGNSTVQGVVVAPTFDFGDAPNTYLTTLSANGPRHRLGSALFFGATAATDVDSEADGQPSTFADADDTTGQFDESGISGQSNSVTALEITAGTTATVFVRASASGLLDAFLDFNDDGDFADAGEQIFSSQSLTAGVNTLTFAVPAAATGGANNITIGRWRISSTGGLSFTGEAIDGEVEDHSVDVAAAVIPGSISGLKFIDANGNGQRDAQEGGQAGVTIFLDTDNDGQLDAGEITSTTIVDNPATQANETGTYAFANLQPGPYSVCEVLPANTVPTLPSGARPCFAVTLANGQQRTGLDFGNLPVDPNASNSFAGFVYADVNDNGIKDAGEISLPNVTLTMTGPVTRTAKTDQNGAYRFLNLPSGVYAVTQSQPAAFLDGKETRGAPALGDVGQDTFVQLNLAGNINAIDYNFGERGLIQQLISKRLFLASTPLANQAVGVIQAQGEGEWVSFVAAKSGYFYARPTSGTTLVEYYTSSFMPLGASAPGEPFSAPIGEGEKVVMFVQGEEPNVSVEVQIVPTGEHLNSTENLAADASGDGQITPQDALVIVNELNNRLHTNAAGQILHSTNTAAANFDTNKDGFVTAVDALVVINVLNARRTSAEGELSPLTIDTGSEANMDATDSNDQLLSQGDNADLYALPVIAASQSSSDLDSRRPKCTEPAAVDQALEEYLAECLSEEM